MLWMPSANCNFWVGPLQRAYDQPQSALRVYLRNIFAYYIA